MLLEDVLKEFIFDCQLRKMSPKTIKGYKNNNLSLFRFFKTEYGVTQLNEVHYKLIQGYIKFLTDKGLRETYINGLIKSFRAFFKYCYKEGYIKINPMDKIEFQKEPNTLILTFTDEEVVKLIRHYSGRKFLDVRNRLIMILLFDTGIRNTELCDLKLTDVRESHLRIYGKGKKERFVPITPAINKALIQYYRVRTAYIKDKVTYETEYLLLSQKGKKLTVETLERIVHDAAVECDVRDIVRASPHTCRHYYAQSQLRNGCDLYTLSKLLGHSNLNITKIYLKSMQDDLMFDMAVRTSPLTNLRI